MRSKVAKVIEEKDRELRLLKLQMAKQKYPEETEDAEQQMAVKKEIEFQNAAYKQTQEQASNRQAKNDKRMKKRRHYYKYIQRTINS